MKIVNLQFPDNSWNKGTIKISDNLGRVDTYKDHTVWQYKDIQNLYIIEMGATFNIIKVNDNNRMTFSVIDYAPTFTLVKERFLLHLEDINDENFRFQMTGPIFPLYASSRSLG